MEKRYVLLVAVGSGKPGIYDTWSRQTVAILNADWPMSRLDRIIDTLNQEETNTTSTETTSTVCDMSGIVYAVKERR
jgi:hypothetical protein